MGSDYCMSTPRPEPLHIQVARLEEDNRRLRVENCRLRLTNAFNRLKDENKSLKVKLAEQVLKGI